MRPFARRAFVLGLVSTMASLSASLARAATPPEDVIEPIATLDRAILDAWREGSRTSFKQRYDMLRPAVMAALDLPAILRASVGLPWRRLSQEDREALMAAFEAYTIASYAAGFADYNGQSLEIDPEARRLGDDWIVQTQIMRRDGSRAKIDYVMRRDSDDDGGQWKAADILLDGTISRVGVQRSDFRGFLDEGSAARLIASLRRQTSDLSGGTM